jgi:hypothetical protein
MRVPSMERKGSGNLVVEANEMDEGRVGQEVAWRSRTGDGAAREVVARSKTAMKKDIILRDLNSWIWSRCYLGNMISSFQQQLYVESRRATLSPLFPHPVVRQRKPICKSLF